MVQNLTVQFSRKDIESLNHPEQVPPTDLLLRDVTLIGHRP